MRRDRQRLEDILQALDKIAEMIGNSSEEAFFADEPARDAVAYRLAVVGEACSRLTADIRSKYPTVPWNKAISLRNIVVHDYFGVDWEVIWDTARFSAPPLREQIAAILAEEFPDKP
jgi:uncharacterized protein with HEPN domain